MLDIPSYLLGLQSGGGSAPVLESLEVYDNGEYTPDEGVDGFDHVNVQVPEPVLETLTVTANGTYTPEEGVDGFDEVEVNVQGGGSSVPSKDVNFIDYDGTITNSYTAAEFAALTAMPDNPSHDGLTSQGWNWKLSDAQNYVAKYGGLIIGQMYITDDGKTRIYIHLEEGRLAPYLGFAINGTAVIDWGDGSETNTVIGTSDTKVISTQHTYTAAGDYVIIIDVTGSMILRGNSNTGSQGSQLLYKRGSTKYQNRVYQNAVRQVEIGSNITIGDSAFHSCYSLSSITIPDDVTTIGSYAFCECYSLSSITIPDNVTTIGSDAFSSYTNLSSITIPNSVTTIGDNAFSSCFNLSSITIPDSVTTVGSNVFSNCHTLTSITILDGVTTIVSGMFSSCESLSNVTIPDSVTTIKSSAFSACHGLSFIRFEPITPPTVEKSNAFFNLSEDCIIYVPAGSLEAYTSATNYPSSSKYTYVEY